MSIEHYPDLIGKFVRVNRGGPESSEGLLLAVKRDYIVIFIKHEGFVYYNLEHIKGITLLKHIKHFEKHGQHRNIHGKYKKSSCFLEALRSKKNRLIKVNRGGPDSVTGVLTEVHRDYIKLIADEEQVIMFTRHIKSFSTSLRIVNQLKLVQKKEK